MDMPLSKDVIPVAPPERNIQFTDANNPQSIINMVPAPVKERLEQHLWETPELFIQDERELMIAIRGKQGQKPHGIGPMENRLRIAFWLEYDRAMQSTDSRMQMTRVYGGVCSPDYFYKDIISKPHKFCWIMCPPASYTVAMEEALTYGIERLRDVLDFPLYNKKGEPDTKVGELILKIVEKIDLRQKGAIIQRIQALHAHKNLDKPSVPAESMDELNKRLEQLESKAKETGAAVIDVSPP